MSPACDLFVLLYIRTRPPPPVVKDPTVTVHDIPLATLAGQPTSLGDLPGTLLVVNVASKCGLTPQYEGLERLHERYRDRGFRRAGEDPLIMFGPFEFRYLYPSQRSYK